MYDVVVVLHPYPLHSYPSHVIQCCLWAKKTKKKRIQAIPHNIQIIYDYKYF